MIYAFSLDDVDYEAEVTVTAGRAATGPTLDGPGDPPEPAEIEIENIWLVGKNGRVKIDGRFSTLYAEAEKHMLDHGGDILQQADDDAEDAEADAADERADRRREDIYNGD